MATPIIDRVSKDLAYKLQDPVTTGQAGDNGTRISAAERFRYILRGYRRLVRVVTLLYPNQINKIFTQFYSDLTITTASNGTYNIVSVGIVSEVYEILAKEPAQENYVRAVYVEPQDWLSIDRGINIFYVPDLNTRTYYWTLIEQQLRVIPSTIYNLRLTARLDILKLMETSGQGGVFDLDVSSEYLDLVLTAAATEAYLDIGQPDLANAHFNDYTAQLQVLATKMQKMEIKSEY